MTGETVDTPRGANRLLGRSACQTGAQRRAVENFYREALKAAERVQLDAASEVEGLDDEIALLRVRLRGVAKKHRDDFPLLLRGVELLVKAVSARYRLSKEAEQDLAASLAGVIRGVGVQLMPEAFRDE
jgi:hypothetical protein